MFGVGQGYVGGSRGRSVVVGCRSICGGRAAVDYLKIFGIFHRTVVKLSNSVYIWIDDELALIQSYTSMEGAVMVRKMNPNSLENLKAGAVARCQGKVRCQITILPETKEWLARGGNLSGRIDEMVAKVLKGELVGVRKMEEMESEIVRLRAELERLKS